MNRYPVWGYALIALAVLVAALYTAPNFFGESPAVQVSSVKATVKVDLPLMQRVEDILRKASIPYTQALLDPNSVRVRFTDTDIQLRARDLVEKALNPDPSNPSYVVALNLLSASPNWLTAIRALPMYLGLDLRGGVHFLLQVDMQAALTKRLEGLSADIRTQLRDKNVRHAGIVREGQQLRVRFREAAVRDKAREVIAATTTDLALADRDDGQDLLLVATLKPEAQKRIQEA
ncbi:MAG TPA: protein translocase subunit SecD, partial [Burkholderiales bacterium]|nr:protein translocase subunit SecD [Burkholderiales bacterium]